jgi:hypothetical protein
MIVIVAGNDCKKLKTGLPVWIAASLTLLAMTVVE